jgi:hypothetical protein
MTVGELERRMSYKEFLWWQELYAQEAEERRAAERDKPIGPSRTR